MTTLSMRQALQARLSCRTSLWRRSQPMCWGRIIRWNWQKRNTRKDTCLSLPGEIYGQPDESQEFFTEETYGFVDPLEPRSCYPEGKKAAETMCASYRAEYGLDAKAARLAHTYGPGMSIYDGRVQADFLKNVLFNEDIVMKSEGLPVRTYTYIADAIAGMFLILLNGTEMAYNIGDEECEDINQGAGGAADQNYAGAAFVVEARYTRGWHERMCAVHTRAFWTVQNLENWGGNRRIRLKKGFKRTIEYLEIEKEAGTL